MSICAVTGSASGIGKAVAENLIAQGHGVISIDLRDADITADLSKREDCEAVLAAVLERAPEGLDGFVPCAGVGPEVPNRELIPLVNYFATVTLVNGLMPALERKQGSVVLISSNSSQMKEYDDNYMQALNEVYFSLSLTIFRSSPGVVLKCCFIAFPKAASEA